MRAVRLVVCLAFCVPCLGMLGGLACLDGGNVWWGTCVGALLGVFFGLAFGGARGKWLDWLLGPEEGE